MMLLEVRGITKYFSGLVALRDVNLNVSASEILGLIGPNGAGKTTLFNVISGFYQPSKGKIIFKGEDITGLRPDQIAQRGIGRTFQATNLFMQSTVFENVFTAFHMSCGQPGWKAFLHTAGVTKEEQLLKQRVAQILEFMGLSSIKDKLAGSLPHGYQRILGVCLALAITPELLLLDEPVTGMNPRETQSMIDLVRQIRDSGVTIVLVEHDMRAVMRICDRIVVLNYGQKIAEGPPEEIRHNKEVVQAYLGRGEE